MGSVPPWMRFWELSKLGIASWAVASVAGYYLYLRPKWYPKVEYAKAREFTPKEVEEWNARKTTAPPASAAPTR